MQTTITVLGTLRGAFWWPIGEQWEKPVSQKFVRHRAAGAFEREADTLRDALLEITNDGDSSEGCRMMADSYVEIVKSSDDGRRSRSRVFELSMFPSVADLMTDEWPQGEEY